MDLRIDHVELHAGARIEPLAGESECLGRLFHGGLLAFDGIFGLLEVRDGRLDFGDHTAHVVVVGDLGTLHGRLRLLDRPVCGQPVKDRPTTSGSKEPSLDGFREGLIIFIALDLIATVRIDGGEPTGDGGGHLFCRNQNVRALGLELGVALEGRVDRGVLVNLAWVVTELPMDIEGNLDDLNIRIVHADQLDEAEHGDAQVVFRGDQGGHGIGHLNLRLEHVEAGNRPGVIAALLVGDLRLVKGHLLFVGDHKSPVEDDLVELPHHVGHDAIQGLTELEVSDLLGELGRLREGWGLPAVVEKLGALEVDVPCLVDLDAGNAGAGGSRSLLTILDVGVEPGVCRQDIQLGK